MGSPNIKDLLTSFSPSSDFFAISSGDGRIKVWDTVKGQLQTQFADITSTDDGTGFYKKSGSGHLSLDYTCMKWLTLETKKKKKVGCSLLVLGTGGGDVLALDVSAGQLKWRSNDCHPGGVNAVSYSTKSSIIYTAGIDGMICQIDPATGSLLGKFKASTKAISSMIISPDGQMFATAAAQLKVFNCSDNRKIQKFSGHPGPVRCLSFSGDGKYILSSAVGEKYVAVWKVDGGKKQSASCVLSMEHPAIFLDSKCIESKETDDAGMYVLAISETGLCYFWFGRNIEELRNAKPTTISLSSEIPVSKNQKSAQTMIFAAELQGVVNPGSGQVFAAYGSLIKPSFEKIVVQYGTDIILKSTQDGVLLPMAQPDKSQKGQVSRTRVTALDRANAEDASLPIPKVQDFQEKKRKHHDSSTDPENAIDDLINSRRPAKILETEDDQEKIEDETIAVSMEGKLREMGILCSQDDTGLGTYKWTPKDIFKDEKFEANIPPKKIKATIVSLPSRDAYKLLTSLVAMLKSRPGCAKHVLPWISSILVNHSSYVKSQEPSNQLLESLYKITESKCLAVQPLLQLSGRMQLLMAQIDKAGQKPTQTTSNNEQSDESEDEDEDIDEVVYGEDESESDSDDES